MASPGRIAFALDLNAITPWTYNVAPAVWWLQQRGSPRSSNSLSRHRAILPQSPHPRSAGTAYGGVQSAPPSATVYSPCNTRFCAPFTHLIARMESDITLPIKFIFRSFHPFVFLLVPLLTFVVQIVEILLASHVVLPRHALVRISLRPIAINT